MDSIWYTHWDNACRHVGAHRIAVLPCLKARACSMFFLTRGHMPPHDSLNTQRPHHHHPHPIQAHADTSQLARTANHALPLSAVHSESLDRSLLPFQSSSSSEHPVMCLSASPPLLRPHAMRDSHVAWRAVGPARSPRAHSSSCQAATSAKVQRGVKSRLASARAQLLMLRHV